MISIFRILINDIVCAVLYSKLSSFLYESLIILLIKINSEISWIFYLLRIWTNIC